MLYKNKRNKYDGQIIGGFSNIHIQSILGIMLLFWEAQLPARSKGRSLEEG